MIDHDDGDEDRRPLIEVSGSGRADVLDALAVFERVYNGDRRDIRMARHGVHLAGDPRAKRFADLLDTLNRELLL